MFDAEQYIANALDGQFMAWNRSKETFELKVTKKHVQPLPVAAVEPVQEAPKPVAEPTVCLSREIILKATAKHFGLTLSDLKGLSRNRKLVLARHLYSYIAHLETRSSYPSIAAMIRRDHSSVLHGSHKIMHRVEKHKKDIAGILAIARERAKTAFSVPVENVGNVHSVRTNFGFAGRFS